MEYNEQKYDLVQLILVLKFDHQLLITLLLISIKTTWKFLNKSDYSS